VFSSGGVCHINLRARAGGDRRKSELTVVLQKIFRPQSVAAR
jgi:hypothetical protein